MKNIVVLQNLENLYALIYFFRDEYSVEIIFKQCEMNYAFFIIC